MKTRIETETFFHNDELYCAIELAPFYKDVWRCDSLTSRGAVYLTRSQILNKINGDTK